MFHPFERTDSISTDTPLLISTMEALSDPDPIATMANAASLLNWYLDDINWVGFYIWSETDSELVLGPFQGLPACIRIKSGRGVCGTAIAKAEAQLVDDVHAFPGHIACDSASRAELVLPLYRPDSSLIGVLDIDSPTPGRFSVADADAMTEFCMFLTRKIVSAG